jgi:hypothetical protein
MSTSERPGGRIVTLGVYMTTMPVPGLVSLNKELSFVMEGRGATGTGCSGSCRI